MRKTLIGLAAVSALLVPGIGRAQQAAGAGSGAPQTMNPPPAQQQQSVADAARQAKAQKAAQGQAAGSATTPSSSATASQSASASTSSTPRVFDNDNIPKTGGISAVGSEPSADVNKSGSGDQAAANGSALPSSNDEKSWRQKFKDLHKKLDQDQEDLDLSQRELGVDDVQFYTDPVKGMQQGLTRSDINDKTAKIDELKKRVDADKQAIDDAEQQLRASGGDIGWSR
jgi:hypothetical protein